jgi:hypothetical protein
MELALLAAFFISLLALAYDGGERAYFGAPDGKKT